MPGLWSFFDFAEQQGGPVTRPEINVFLTHVSQCFVALTRAGKPVFTGPAVTHQISEGIIAAQAHFDAKAFVGRQGGGQIVRVAKGHGDLMDAERRERLF